MAEKRARQTPAASVILPYEDTRGGEAVLLYAQSGRTAQEWQQLMMSDIMAVDSEGLWLHMKFGWSIPRRNGKSELLIMRAIWALTHGEQVLYTAHRTTTSSSAWLKIVRLLGKMGFAEGDDFKTTRGHGLEHIEWLKSGGDGVINFRTRTTTGGLGEGYDLLIIDEAQEYTGDQETALKYLVTDSRNPQTLMCGTPPTAVSSGTVFRDYREEVLSGSGDGSSGWAEWSVQALSDTHDPELWYETNPSLGTILTERTIRSELSRDPYSIDDNIQRLGLWLSYNQKSAISKAEWQSHRLDIKPDIGRTPRLFIGVKFAKDGGTVSAALAVKLSDGSIFVEGLDCRSVRDGSAWIAAFAKNPHVCGIAIDGAGGQQILSDELKNAGVKIKPVLPKISEIIAANALFEDRLFSGGICHSGQPALEQAASNCEHRAVGTGGGFGYRSILDGADVTLVEAVSLAHWLCANAKEKRKQRIYY